MGQGSSKNTLQCGSLKSLKCSVIIENEGRAQVVVSIDLYSTTRRDSKEPVHMSVCVNTSENLKDFIRPRKILGNTTRKTVMAT